MAAAKKMSKKQLDELNIELIAMDELEQVSAGDYIDCDVLHQSLLYAGYNATYENILSDINGFISKFMIDGGEIGFVESLGGDHMVRSWRELPESPLRTIMDEYIGLYMALELDDVDCSLSTMEARNKRLGEIQDSVDPDIIAVWEDEIKKRLADPKTMFASGALYNWGNMSPEVRRMTGKHIDRIKKYLLRARVDLEDFNDWLLDAFYKKEKNPVAFFIFEHYNFPDFSGRYYRKDSREKDYMSIMEDYFSDCDGMEDSLIYDVQKGKFFIVSVNKTIDAKEVKLEE